MAVTRSQPQQPELVLSTLLPQRFVANILLRLPPKSLFRFMSVSRSWLAVISSRSFQNRYYAIRAASIPRFLFQSRDCDYHPPSGSAFHDFVTLDRRGNPLDVLTVTVAFGPIKRVLTSCRGLFCFPTENFVYLCNPATHSIIQLPPVDYRRVDSGGVYGLGYVKSTGEYKVVRLGYKRANEYSYYSRECELEPSVFTYPTTGNCWRALSYECRPYFVAEMSLPVFVHSNETIYWKIDHRYHDPDDHGFLVAFDLNEERFNVVGKPAGWQPREGCWTKLIESEIIGKLCMVETLAHHDSLVIWILADQMSSQWVKRGVFQMPSFGHGITVVDVKALWGDGIVLSSLENVIIFFNPRNGTFKKVTIPEGLQNWDFCPYAESLVTLRLPA
ncbi:F-box protein At3g07870 [Linum perenne]